MIGYDTNLNLAIEDLVYRSAAPIERVRHDRRIAQILADVVRERIRQEEIGQDSRARGLDWRSCADPAMAGGDGKRYLVLGEEVGEVANAVLEAEAVPAGQIRDACRRDLRKELVQVAAVTIAWLEAFDAQAEGEAPA